VRVYSDKQGMRELSKLYEAERFLKGIAKGRAVGYTSISFSKISLATCGLALPLVFFITCPTKN